MTPLWTHSDADFDGAMFLWRNAARGHQFRLLQPTVGARALRAGVVESLIAASEAYSPLWFETSPAYIDFGALPSTGHATASHQAAATALLRTWTVLAAGRRSKAGAVTFEGNAPIYQGGVEAGSWLLVARVVVSAVWAIAAAYVATEYEDTIDRALSRAETGHRLLEGQANLTAIVRDHAAQERAAGQSLPYSTEEQSVIAELLKQQQLFANAPEPPRDKPSGGTFGGVMSGFGLGALAIVGALLFLTTRKG